MNIFEQAAFRVETLDQIRLAAVSRCSREVQMAVPPEIFVDETIHGLTVQLEAKLLGRQAERCETVYWPATWWQMFKNQYAPVWFKKRWPVQWDVKAIKVEYFAVCPHLPFDPRERHIRFPIIEARKWDMEG